MGCASFSLTGCLLDGSAGDFISNTLLSSFKSLSFNQFSVSDLLIVFRLLLYDSKLMFFEDLHLGLIECFFNQNVEHGLNLLIKVEKFIVTVVDLS